jgi:hypothetical protein
MARRGRQKIDGLTIDEANERHDKIMVENFGDDWGGMPIVEKWLSGDAAESKVEEKIFDLFDDLGPAKAYGDVSGLTLLANPA